MRICGDKAKRNFLVLDSNVTMKKYFRVYAVLLKMNFLALVAYRVHFFNSLIGSIGWGLLSLFAIVLLTSKTTTVFRWKREELLLLNGMYGIIIGIFHTVFSRNFERFASVIHFGQLDTVLVKPFDSQFLLSFWMFGYSSLSRIVIAFLYTMYISQQLRVSFAPIHVIFFLLLMIISLLLLYSLWFIVITTTVWFTRLSNLVALMFNITGMARYPQEMFHQLVNYVFIFLLPLTLIITVPTKVYLQRLHLFDVGELLSLSLIFFFISRRFWKFALRYYTSASS